MIQASNVPSTMSPVPPHPPTNGTLTQERDPRLDFHFRDRPQHPEGECVDVRGKHGTTLEERRVSGGHECSPLTCPYTDS